MAIIVKAENARIRMLCRGRIIEMTKGEAQDLYRALGVAIKVANAQDKPERKIDGL
jgi:hypothetical protein